MAELAVHDKKAADKTFLDCLPLIVREASDERNFVKKAVNWALRQIGKRNAALNCSCDQNLRRDCGFWFQVNEMDCCRCSS
jgi:hypothetical protein